VFLKFDEPEHEKHHAAKHPPLSLAIGVFWIFKQDIRIGDNHHQKRNRVEARIHLHFILAQVTRDVATFFKCSPKNIVRGIRRSPDTVLHELGFPSAFAEGTPWESVLHVGQAA